MIRRRTRLAATAVILLGLAGPLAAGPAAMADDTDPAAAADASAAAETTSDVTDGDGTGDPVTDAATPGESGVSAEDGSDADPAAGTDAPAGEQTAPEDTAPEDTSGTEEPAAPEEPATTGPIAITGASFEWGINNESNGGAYFGVCNFLSAGVAGDAGSSRVWTQADGFYRTSEGNTTIVKPTANDGSGEQSPTWASKCLLPDGTRLVQPTSNNPLSYTQTKVRITEGTGTVDPETDDAEIQWRGSFTVAYYGGMTYWSVTDPKLTVVDGVGTLTGLVTGYGADMDDPTIWTKLADRRNLPLATLSGVQVDEDGITVTPDYLGVSIPAEVDGRNPQAVKTSVNASYWGAFPAEFLRYQLLTGQSSYWYTSEGGPNTLQPRKTPSPIVIGFDGPSEPEPAQPLRIVSQPADSSVPSRQDAVFEVAVAGGSGHMVAWQRQTAGGSWATLKDGSTVSGAATSALRLTGVTSAQSGTSYRAVIRSADGAEEIVSRAARLTVTAKTLGSIAPFSDQAALAAALRSGAAIDRTTDAGLPDGIRTGDEFTARIPWTTPVRTGDDTTAEVWLYPQREYLGTFRVSDAAALFTHLVSDGETGTNWLVFAVDDQRAAAVRFDVAPAAVELDDALFSWGLNEESTGGSYFGGCNFLSAGVAGDSGSSRLWTEGDGLYRSTAGNTSIVMPTADGKGSTVQTWATKCRTPSGTSINGKATNASDSHSQASVRITGGTGVLDAVEGTADIQWRGSFTVAYYGGMTYWSASDPKLVVRADGTGTVTATVSGYGTDMDDASKWSALRSRTVTLATLSGVEVTPTGIVATPQYLGVSVPADVGGRNAQAAATNENRSWWGAFPADFLRFQMETGQSSYWYTTPGGAGTIQPRKVPLPITVCATSDCTVRSTAGGGDDGTASVVISQNTRKAPVRAPQTAVQAYAPAASGAATVVIIKRPAAVAALPVDDQLVLVAAGALIAAFGLLALVGAAGGVLFATGAIRQDVAATAPPR